MRDLSRDGRDEFEHSAAEARAAGNFQVINGRAADVSELDSVHAQTIADRQRDCGCRLSCQAAATAQDTRSTDREVSYDPKSCLNPDGWLLVPPSVPDPGAARKRVLGWG